MRKTKFFILGVGILASGVGNVEAKTLSCVENSSRMPSLTIHPAKEGDELMVVFKTPQAEKNKLDDVKGLKIQDPTGQMTLIFLNYVGQTSDVPENFYAETVKALKKYRLYLTQEVSKANGTGKEILAATALSTTEFMLRAIEDRGVITAKEWVGIIRDAVGPMTDYDENMRFAYSQYENGKYLKKDPAHPKSFLPEEFYTVASSTKTGGVVDMKELGKSHCLPRGVLGSGNSTQASPASPTSSSPAAGTK